MRATLAIPLLATAGATAIAACGGDGPTQPPGVASVQVTPATAALAAIGETVQFSATPRDAQGNPVAGKTASWSSAPTAVAGIDQAGLATAAANGSSTITATVDGKTGTATLTVTQRGDALRIATHPAGASAGRPLTTQPVAEILDARGNVVINDNTTTVTASIASGGGALASAVATASAGVVTFTELAVNGLVGERALRFAAEGLVEAVSDPFTVTPGPADRLALVAGDAQVGLAAMTLPTPLSVRVTDAFTNPVAAVDVSWTVTTGSGAPSASTTPSEADGIAAVSYTLGRFAGDEAVEASTTGLNGSPVVFRATATPNGTIRGTLSLGAGGAAPAAAHKVSVGGAALQRPASGKQLAPRVSAASGIARNPVAPAPPAYTPDELIVTFHPTAIGAPRIGAQAHAFAATAERTASSMRAALAPHLDPERARLRGTSPAILAARIAAADVGRLDVLAAELRANPAVARVERNGIVQLEAPRALTDAARSRLPNDPLYVWQAWHYAMADLPEAWTLTTGDATVLVAVVDDGIRFDHPGVAANLTSDGYDFVSDLTLPLCAGGDISNAGDGDGYDSDPTQPAAYAYNGTCVGGLLASGNHGLHVAGTIGAVGNDAAGGAGVNWTVRIRPVRGLGVAGTGTNYDLAQGVLYAAGLPADDGAGGTVQPAVGARVINASFGGGPSTVMENAVLAATNAGALIIAAAGNSASTTPLYPAAYPQSLSVSAVGPDTLLASYSNYGTTVDVAAPGGDLGDGGADFGVISSAWDFTTSTALWDAWQGTSMAAPHVSGVAALVLARDPGLTRDQLRARLEDFAVDIGPAGPDNQYGRGLVNARNGLTQSLAPPRALYARLVDATTGASVATATAAPDGTYEFRELGDADYYVYAGQDADGDGLVGVAGRRWDAFGGAPAPSALTINGAGTTTASFSVGLPREVEGNDSFGTADALPVGGYMLGAIADPATDADVYRVRVPSQGTYTFETSANDGACGFALEEDTILQLFDETATLLAEHDDVDLDGNNFCSRISMSLGAGTYFIAVFGWYGRPYRLTVRAGS